MGTNAPLSINIDSTKLTGLVPFSPDTLLWLYNRGAWRQGRAPAAELKGAHRYGTFKDLFRNDVVFVYGTAGDAEEQAWAFNKSRFDAERFWYHMSSYAREQGAQRHVSARSGEAGSAGCG
jgi:hypothetical protein